MTRKYASLLTNDDVRRWYENLRARSQITANVYLRTLGYYSHLTATTPHQILDAARADSKAFRDNFIDFVRQLERDGKAGSYITRFKKVLRSWLSFNDVTVALKVNIAGEYATPTIDHERIPTKVELDRVLRMASPRARVSIALMAFSGLHPQTLGNHAGTDGLRLSDFTEAEVTETEMAFPVVPSPLVVRRGLSKARHQYLTFISEQGITYLQEYLDQRVQQGEPLSAETPVLGFDLRGHHTNRWLRTTLVTRDIKAAIVRSGYAWRPYVLRSYFDTNMIIAENQGQVSHPYLQFFMGHKGDMEARYSTNKGRLPPDMVEDMRRAFRDCTAYLTTLPSREREDPELTTIRTMVESGVLDLAKPNVRQYLVNKLGLEDMDARVAKLRATGLNDEAATIHTLCGALGIEPSTLDAFQPKDPKMIVSEFELPKYLEEGWDVQTVLPSGKILIKK